MSKTADMKPENRKPVARDASGKVVGGGGSLNPGGRPKGYAEFREACRQHSPEALARLVACLRSEDERIAVSAAQALLERAWGRPAAAPEDLDAERAKNPLAGWTPEQLLAAAKKDDKP